MSSNSLYFILFLTFIVFSLLFFLFCAAKVRKIFRNGKIKYRTTPLQACPQPRMKRQVYPLQLPTFLINKTYLFTVDSK